MIRPLTPSSQQTMWKAHDAPVLSAEWNAVNNLIVSGGEDCTVRLWEVDTGRCSRVWKAAKAVTCVAWNPNAHIHLAAVCSGTSVLVLDPATAPTDDLEGTAALLAAPLVDDAAEEADGGGGGGGASGTGGGPSVTRDSLSRRRPTASVSVNESVTVSPSPRKTTRLSLSPMGAHVSVSGSRNSCGMARRL